MSYAVTVSLDIENGETEDYEAIYAYFEKIGLHRKIKGEKEHTLPTTTLYGVFDGQSSVAVRDYISEQTELAYKEAKVSGKVFIATDGVDHTWGIRYPKHA